MCHQINRFIANPELLHNQEIADKHKERRQDEHDQQLIHGHRKGQIVVGVPAVIGCE